MDLPSRHWCLQFFFPFLIEEQGHKDALGVIISKLSGPSHILCRLLAWAVEVLRKVRVIWGGGCDEVMCPRSLRVSTEEQMRWTEPQLSHGAMQGSAQLGQSSADRAGINKHGPGEQSNLTPTSDARTLQRDLSSWETGSTVRQRRCLAG